MNYIINGKTKSPFYGHSKILKQIRSKDEQNEKED